MEEVLILNKNVVLIAPHFPPLNSSAAVQLNDLALALSERRLNLTVLVPSAEISHPFILEKGDGFQLLKLKVPKFRDVSNVRRVIAEFLMPFFMLWALRKSEFNKSCWDGLVWYSPSIFFSPLIKSIKKKSGCKAYLIIRDIFPDWMVDLGLMKKRLPYFFLKWIEGRQYKLADTIGVQTSANLTYFESRSFKGKLEVLHNWLKRAPLVACSLCINNTKLKGRKIFVYAGNMGVAQDMGVFLDLAKQMNLRKDVGFLFVGRGSQAGSIKALAELSDNILFCPEIDSKEIPGLYAQCHFGMVSLNRKHKIHNIPGKFLSYISAGIPVLACVNEANDLIEVVEKYGVGEVDTTYSAEILLELANKLLIRRDQENFSVKCLALSEELFSPSIAVSKIFKSLNL